MKDKIVKDFCESANGERWFLELAMPMIIASMTELVKGIGEANPHVDFPNIANAYCWESI